MNNDINIIDIPPEVLAKRLVRILSNEKDQFQIKSLLINFILIFFFSFSLINASWEKTYGGMKNDFGNAIKQTNDGGFIIAGTTESFNDTSGLDGWIIKLDKYGYIQWDYTFGKLIQKDGFQTIELTDDGGFLVGGFFDFNKMWLLKFDENGSLLWDSVYISKLASSINIIRHTYDGNFIIGGFGENNIIKIDSNGNRIWNAKFGYVIKDIEPLSDSSFILVGENVGIPQEFGYIPAFVLYKIDSSGNTILENPYGKNDLGSFISVTKTYDGGFVAVGNKISKVNDMLYTRQLIVVKFDKFGAKQWEHLGIDNSGGIAVQSSGQECIIAGYYPGPEGYPDNYTAIINDNSTLKWDTTFGGNLYDYPSDILVLENGSIVIVGQTESEGKFLYDIQVVKLDSLLNPTNIDDNSNFINNTKIMNYPNPINDITTFLLNLENIEPGIIKMNIYSQTGELISTFDNFSNSECIYFKTINTDKFANGIYYYKIFLSRKILSGRIVIQK